MTTGDSIVSVCIPARQGSSRFPGKPLATLGGKPLIQHVYEAVQPISSVGQILVVTDNEAILETVKGFGGEVCLVTEPCRTGTDRVAKVASQLTYDWVVNLQADEVLLHPELLDNLIQPFVKTDYQIGTLKRTLRAGDRNNPSIVKVVTDQQGRALYFSRSAIPCWRDGIPSETKDSTWMHLGVYIFQKTVLQQFSQLPSGFLEDAEKLEQLRALEHGLPIMVWETKYESLRIDTPEDLALAESILLKNKGTH